MEAFGTKHQWYPHDDRKGDRARITLTNDPHGSSMRPHVRQRRVLAYTRRTVSLNGAVQSLQQRFGYKHLRLGNLLSGRRCVAVVNANGGVEDDEPCSVDINSRLRDTLELDFVLGELSAEWFFAWIIDAGDEVVESLFSLLHR